MEAVRKLFKAPSAHPDVHKDKLAQSKLREREVKSALKEQREAQKKEREGVSGPGRAQPSPRAAPADRPAPNQSPAPRPPIAPRAPDPSAGGAGREGRLALRQVLQPASAT
jgi:hypothetical protein